MPLYIRMLFLKQFLDICKWGCPFKSNNDVTLLNKPGFKPAFKTCHTFWLGVSRQKCQRQGCHGFCLANDDVRTQQTVREVQMS